MNVLKVDFCVLSIKFPRYHSHVPRGSTLLAQTLSDATIFWQFVLGHRMRRKYFHSFADLVLLRDFVLFCRDLSALYFSDLMFTGNGQ